MNDKEEKFFKDRMNFVNELGYKARHKQNIKLEKKLKIKKLNILFNKVSTIIIIILTFLGVLIASIFGYLTYISEL